MTDKKLTKSNKHRMLFGVCGGFADFFGIDPTIARLIFVVLGLIKGIGILVYIICIFVIPSEFEKVEDKSEEQEKPKVSAKKSSEKSKKAPHTDEEFDSYFSNK